MKKLAASILLLVYFVVSTGFVVSIHYCMNKIDSVQFGSSSSEECSKCGMHIEDSGGCCKDDVKVIKMQADQSVAKIQAPDFSLQITVSPVSEFYLAPFIKSLDEEFPLSHGPPLSDQDTYLRNCVFRL